MDSLEVINEKYNSMLDNAINRYLYEKETVEYFYIAFIIPAIQIMQQMGQETQIVERLQRIRKYNYNTLLSEEYMTIKDTVPKYEAHEIVYEAEKFINKYELEEFERITKYDLIKQFGSCSRMCYNNKWSCYDLRTNEYLIDIVKERQLIRLKPIIKYLKRQYRLYKKQIEKLNNNLL